MDDYNLYFIEIKTDLVWRGKRITASDYVIINPETNEKEFLTLAYLRRRFFSDDRNVRTKQESIRKCKTIFHYV